MAKGVQIGVHERMKHEASQGFDTPGNLKPWIKTALIVAAIAAVVIGAIYVSQGGGVRNCIKSVMGNLPDCSDNDGSPKKTYVNGRYIGVCTSVDTDGTCIG